MFFPVPPPVIVPAPQTLPPLSFAGFRAGMPLAEATSRITRARGTLSCKPTSDQRIRDCTGTLPSAGSAAAAFAILISSIQDSAAVMVFSSSSNTHVSASWVKTLTETFGRPNHEAQPGQTSWQWIRAGRMLRVVERKRGGRWEASVTLTHGPLLDGLGKP